MTVPARTIPTIGTPWFRHSFRVKVFTLPHATARRPDAGLDGRCSRATARLADPGLYRFDELWIALGEGPAFDDYASGWGQYAEQALAG